MWRRWSTNSLGLWTCRPVTIRRLCVHGCGRLLPRWASIHLEPRGATHPLLKSDTDHHKQYSCNYQYNRVSFGSICTCAGHRALQYSFAKHKTVDVLAISCNKKPSPRQNNNLCMIQRATSSIALTPTADRHRYYVVICLDADKHPFRL